MQASANPNLHGHRRRRIVANLHGFGKELVGGNDAAFRLLDLLMPFGEFLIIGPTRNVLAPPLQEREILYLMNKLLFSQPRFLGRFLGLLEFSARLFVDFVPANLLILRFAPAAALAESTFPIPRLQPKAARILRTIYGDASAVLNFEGADRRAVPANSGRCGRCGTSERRIGGADISAAGNPLLGAKATPLKLLFDSNRGCGCANLPVYIFQLLKRANQPRQSKQAGRAQLQMTSASAGSVYSLSLGYALNGDMTSTTDSVNGTWTYSYDDSAKCAQRFCLTHGVHPRTWEQFWKQNLQNKYGFCDSRKM